MDKPFSGLSPLRYLYLVRKKTGRVQGKEKCIVLNNCKTLQSG